MTKGYLGIDAGGTKVSYILFDNNKNILTEGYIEVDGNVGTNPKLNETFNTIIDTCEKVNDGVVIEVIFAGIAGFDSYPHSDQFINSLNTTAKIHFQNDVVALCNSNFPDSDGLIVNSGTGAAIVAKINGEVGLYSGWGYILGDQGSGFDVGKKIIEKYLLLWEQKINNSATETFEKLTGCVGRDIISKVYANESKKVVADLSAVFANAEDFVDCYQNSAIDIANHCNLLFSGKNLEIKFNGSLFSKNENYKKAFFDQINFDATETELSPIAHGVLNYIN